MIRFLKWLFGSANHSSQVIPRPTSPSVPNQMDQGDYHSGPYGYTPNTAYPETQYGSGFDEDAEWNEEH